MKKKLDACWETRNVEKDLFLPLKICVHKIITSPAFFLLLWYFYTVRAAPLEHSKSN